MMTEETRLLRRVRVYLRDNQRMGTVHSEGYPAGATRPVVHISLGSYDAPALHALATALRGTGLGVIAHPPHPTRGHCAGYACMLVGPEPGAVARPHWWPWCAEDVTDATARTSASGEG